MGIEIFADNQLPPPQPSDVDESGSLPEKAPGSENKLPEQPAPEPSAPEDLGKVIRAQNQENSLCLLTKHHCDTLPSTKPCMVAKDIAVSLCSASESLSDILNSPIGFS